jgi:hypothetical protein
MIDTLASAKDALARHAWGEAMDAFAAADRDGDLSPEDLELLGTAAWWSGQPDESTDALERAYASHVEAGRNLDAARVALELVYRAFQRLAAPLGASWLARAERLLESEPESAVHAALLDYQALGALMSSRRTEAIELSDRAMEVARRQDSPDALFTAMTFKGTALLASGSWKEGLALIDEAAAAASRASSTCASRATSSATRCRRAARSATSSGPGNGRTRANAGCVASPSAATRASAGSIEPS